MAAEPKDNFESPLGSSIPEPTMQVAAAEPQPKAPPPSYDYGGALTAGFSVDELKQSIANDNRFSGDDLAKEYAKIDAAKPAQQAAPAPAARSATEIPEPPAPIPGIYSPEKEQTALRAVNDIADPELRRVAIERVKQNFATLKLMDGVTAQVREQAKVKSIAKWSNIVEQIVTGESDWATKQAVMGKVIAGLRADPTLDVGETKNLLEEHLLKQAGMPDVRELGPSYIQAQDGVVKGLITSNDQILRMEAEGRLTHKGAEWAMQSLTQKRTPKGRIDADRTEFFKSIERTIDPSMSQDAAGQASALGRQHLYLAERAARAREAEIIEAKGNPSDIYTPGTKEYFGRPENLKKYVVTLKQATDYAKQVAKGEIPEDPLQQSMGHPSVAPAPAVSAPTPQPGDRKQFKQGWGVWNGTTWVPAP